jgi:hypothetical protein
MYSHASSIYLFRRSIQIHRPAFFYTDQQDMLVLQNYWTPEDKASDAEIQRRMKRSCEGIFGMMRARFNLQWSQLNQCLFMTFQPSCVGSGSASSLASWSTRPRCISKDLRSCAGPHPFAGHQLPLPHRSRMAWPQQVVEGSCQ